MELKNCGVSKVFVRTKPCPRITDQGLVFKNKLWVNFSQLQDFKFLGSNVDKSKSDRQTDRQLCVSSVLVKENISACVLMRCLCTDRCVMEQRSTAALLASQRAASSLDAQTAKIAEMEKELEKHKAFHKTLATVALEAQKEVDECKEAEHDARNDEAYARRIASEAEVTSPKKDKKKKKKTRCRIVMSRFNQFIFNYF
jgi:hypothetical protein